MKYIIEYKQEPVAIITIDNGDGAIHYNLEGPYSGKVKLPTIAAIELGKFVGVSAMSVSPIDLLKTIKAFTKQVEDFSLKEEAE